MKKLFRGKIYEQFQVGEKYQATQGRENCTALCTEKGKNKIKFVIKGQVMEMDYFLDNMGDLMVESATTTLQALQDEPSAIDIAIYADLKAS